jgi:fructose-1,6-bisphosphatase I
MLVYTTGNSVNRITLNLVIVTFYSSHANIQILKTGTIYSANERNYCHFPQGVINYIKYCQKEEENRPYTYRYIGWVFSVRFSQKYAKERYLYVHYSTKNKHLY